MYLARVVALGAGIPKEAPSYTVNFLCGTGVQTIVSAAHAIQAGEADVALAGGAESMSRGPYWTSGPRWGARLREPRLVDSVAGALTDPFDGQPLGVTAERIAVRHGISRERQDAYAAESHRRAAAACSAGRFASEIVAVDTASRRGTTRVDRDERIRIDASTAELATLKPAFAREGTVTAGNASGLADGGAAVVLMSARAARRRGAPVLGRVVASASCGVDPRVMGLGPVPAVRKALERAGRSLADVGAIELSEAFAAQALAVIDALALDDAMVNPDGGVIALGHPVAATGTALVVKLLAQMQRDDRELGLVTLCVGGGHGIAMLVQRD